MSPGAVPLRDAAEAAWRAGIAAVQPQRCVARHLAARPFVPSNSPSTLVVAAGKAAASMMRGALPVARGLVLCPRGSDAGAFPAGIEVLYGGHPEPSLEGIENSRRVLKAVAALTSDESLLFLLSGGASALLEVPAGDLTADDLIAAHRALVGSGAPIGDINRVRCCLSAIKGGALAAAAAPARVWTLAISDVVGDDPATIGSAPTFACPRDPGRALDIIARYSMRMPAAVLAHLRSMAGEAVAADAAKSGGVGNEAGAAATPPEARYEILAGVGDAVEAAALLLEQRGWQVERWAGPLTGPTDAAAAQVAGRIAAMLEARQGESGPGRAPRPRALVAGGETTVALPPNCQGRGGRNLDLAARIALALSGRDGFACAVAGSDGADGSSRAAGAVVDGGSADRALTSGFPLGGALAAFDTEAALEASGDALITGATGTNVGDLLVAVCGERAG